MQPLKKEKLRPEERRNGDRIKAWMAENRFTGVAIGKRAGGVNHRHVSDTIKGRRNHRKVLKVFQDLGCPEEHLGLPDDMPTKDEIAAKLALPLKHG